MLKWKMLNTSSPEPSRGVLWAAALLLLLAGGLPRLIWPDLGEVLFPDEMRDYHRVIQLVEGKDFPVDGPTRWTHGRDAFPGAMWYYLMAIPYGISHHPAAGLLFQNLLGTLSVLVFFLLGRRMFGFQVAFWAALLYALSPWSILIGRKLWNPHLVPLFSMVFFYATWRWVDERRPWFLALALTASGVILQIHPIFLPMLISLPLFALYLGKEGWKPLPWILGGFGFALTYSPFLVHEVRHGFPVVQSFFRPGAPVADGGAALEGLKSFLYPFVMTTPELSDYLRKGTLEFDGPWLPVVVLVTFGLILTQAMALGALRPRPAGPSAEGFLPRIKAHLSSAEVKPVFFTAVFLILFILVNLARMAMAVPRYFIPVYPLLFLLSVAWLFRHPGDSAAGWRGVFSRSRYLFLGLTLAVGAALSFQYLYGWHRGVTYHNQSKNVVRYYMEAARWAVAHGGKNLQIEGEDAVRWKGERDAISDLTTLVQDALGYRGDLSAPPVRIRIWVSDPSRPSLPPSDLLRESKDFAQFANLWLFVLR